MGKSEFAQTLPRPRQTSRHANMSRVLQTSLCVLSEALSWLTVRPLVCETSCLAVRMPRTHRGTWKGFLGHDYDEVTGLTNSVIHGCAISELKPPAAAAGPGKALLPKETGAKGA